MELSQLELIGSAFVLVQAIMTVPAVYRLYVDKVVAGMSLWTMSFYCFVSWYYVPIFFMADMPWTGVGVAILGTVEGTWCAWAAVLIRRARRGT